MIFKKPTPLGQRRRREVFRKIRFLENTHRWDEEE